MHTEHMKRCINLARLAEGHTAPNPMVGAVVVKDGQVMAEGYHRQYGGAHAEVDALSKLGNKAEGATLYVNLEPCSHFGKTPPCADLVVRSGIKKLIVGMTDPNPLVSGRGIEKCRQAGVEVVVGVLEEECRELNEVFVKNITQKKTFVALKTATTLDGKVATRTGSSKWITNEKSRAYVQKLRNKYDGILTSASTVLADNPALTCRMDGGRNPVRIILDKDGIVPIDYKVFEDNSTRVVVCQKSGLKKDYPSYVDVLECPVKDNHLDLKYVISQLYEMQIFSVMVEAGGTLNGAFLKEGLVDKFYQFIAPKIIGDDRAKSFVSGLNIEDVSNCIELVPKHLHFFDKDVIIEACVE